MNNLVEVPWKYQTNTWWNNTCADIVEVFGLPGDRYRTEVSTECMKFFFKTDEDAFMCKIMISDRL